MANSNLSNSENILVKVDQNNLIYIDPNSIITKEGEIQPRGVEQEKLVMYVNLEADIVPRSILASANDQQTLTQIAKGTLNFLNKGGTSKDFDTSWTDAFVGQDTQSYDKDGNPTNKINLNNPNFDSTGQSFGIDSITISVKGANFVPQVNINFIDVRGKTLFESAENSPYKAFFHIPWPIFYLTVKGFYGKAIRYRLHLVKFNTKYNDNNGNFEVSTSFVGSTYAYLNDIPLKGILNAPYMYMSETTAEPEFNTHTGTYTQKVSKGARGYEMLKSVYSEYKQKGLIPVDFPVRTLRELGVLAQSLDKLLEKKIFDQVVSMEIFSGIKDFTDVITGFESEIKAWAKRHLTVDKVSPQINDTDYYYINGTNKTDTTWITGSTNTGTLEKVIEIYKEKLKNSELFSNKVLKNSTGATFSKQRILSRNINTVTDYYKTIDGGKIVVAIDLLVNHIQEIRKSFDEQRDKLELAVEEQMNQIIKAPDKEGGLGFEPTVRNIFTVILANAEVYIRLMKDVHRKAFDVSNQRKELIKGFSKEYKGDAIYPWPEIKKTASGNKQQVIAYPAEPELQEKLNSHNKSLWPEVDFLENYVGIATNKYDPLGQKEGGVNNISYVFESDIDESKIKNISSLSTISNLLPYYDKAFPSFLYEIYERAKTFTLIDTLDKKSIIELANAEFENISESIKEDNDLLGILHNNVTRPNILITLLKSVSYFERYPYYVDQIVTQPYLKDSLIAPFKLEQYKTESTRAIDNTSFSGLSESLRTFNPESYRKNIFPFNSDLYLSYINKTSYNDENYKFRGFIDVNLKEGFISSVINPKFWVKTSDGIDNLFSQKLTVGKNSTHILNTPYFHKQLFNDFNKQNGYGKFTGAGYLLLNSLPFVDLEDTAEYLIKGKANFRISSLFREIGASHYIPYHLILKWGSIYHRYKKYLLEGIDILNGMLLSGNTTTINGSLFFNHTGETNNQTFEINGETVVSTPLYPNQTDVGIHPFYDTIYHQVVNGYGHYDYFSGSTSFETNLTNKAITERMTHTNNLNYWTGFVDNSVFNPKDLRYTLLPSDGANQFIGKKVITEDTNTARLLNVIPGVAYESNNPFSIEEQSNFRVIWEDEKITDGYSSKLFPKPTEYHRTYVSGSTRTYDNKYAIGTNYRKVVDLIGTFSPQILDEFENMFLQFVTEQKIEEIPYKRFSKVNYYSFQDLLKEIVSVKKETSDSTITDVDTLITKLQERQQSKLKDVTQNILSNDNLIKFTMGNPKELDAHVLDGFIGITTGNTFSTNQWYSLQETTDNLNLIKLYIGEDINGYFLEFFRSNNIEISEENILQFRPIVLIYGGYRADGGLVNPTTFKTYLKTNIFTNAVSDTNGVGGADYRFNLFLETLIPRFRELREVTTTNRISIIDGYNNRDLKIELYNYFKSFNDKWIAGNSIGQRSLLEEFLFLDKANKDIGDKVYLNLNKIIPLIDNKNSEQNLYGAIAMLIAGTGFDMRALPAYVNFYGTNFSNKSKITPSKKVAGNLFGTFLEVDYQESAPKIVIQYTGPASKHPDMESKSYKFSDDSFNISNVNNNPLIITTPEVFNTGDLAKSNKVVAFEVSFGDQNQSIFKGVQLDQSSIRNTTESFVVLENLARSESGAGAYNVDIGLFEYYRQASYTCEVTCMGNVMIQPTMFFYLKNIPMFKGSYWITEVSHSIKNNNITTTFKGTRIPYASLPDPKDSFLSSYRTLFDTLMNKAIAKVKEADKLKTPTSYSITTPEGTFTIDPGNTKIGGEEIVKDAGVTQFGVPYNGYNGERYIQKVNYGGRPWFRAVAVRMGSEKYPINDDSTMSLINQLTSKFGVVKPSSVKWGDIKDSNLLFYSTKFQLSPSITADKIVTGKTTFLNPNKSGSTPIELLPDYQLNADLGERRVNGPINVGPAVNGYGIGLSTALITKLGIQEGDVVYFDIS